METAGAFGRGLQQERERRGISLDAIAQATQVAAGDPRALESDDLASLPGGVFNKGFVRSYCRFVGLDEDEWVARMASSPNSNGQHADWAVFAENVKRNRERIAPGMRRRWWGVVLMVVALVAVGWAM